ncbi:asparagine synthase (glutamine-hydrolyzing) [Zobellia galactanivorans]|uniref:asparagine synthase (glutamine-hydrolyzing) n=1 Tax=Zobellia galactanivorans (strain DSM 12802 / CCUG 47099 / CIP 106680 / NCIMB 13871 / Dsij) TaxID=63186 RepID=G0L1U1_ZOBGA|nr:asparagine synthase (glutamine-hydrolyzing) [Zobellia galactanivorans]CAZ97901.1 Asparagine synthase B [Zobellia galactanivorans]
MCGIYGSTINYSEDKVKAKLAITSYRGPDQMGWQNYNYSKGNIIFGHNRLSIIDLDPRSNQPMAYAEKVHIVFNGEIYNFKTLKQNLEKKGYSFTTTSDTEVICAAYLEYGEECASHLNGMFAFVIYDIENQILFGAKDRLGQKPFYYYLNGEQFEFASQISSIQLFHNKLSISEKSIQEYFTWNSVPSPSSIFNEIKKLEDGHSFTYNLSNSDFKTQQYWDIDLSNKGGFNGDFQRAQNQLEELLTDAVGIRLVADVPVGVFLSGGVDSSLIAAMASKVSTEKVKTFSVKFNEKRFDESTYAQQVADHLRTDHHIIECDYNEGIALIDNFCDYYDEPFADPSAIPSMLLAKHTKQKVTVALSGDGGDEGFLGYPRYQWAKANKKIYKLPLFTRKIAATLLNLSPFKNNRLEALSHYIRLNSIENAYLRSMTNSEASWFEPTYETLKIKELKYLFHTQKNIYERISDFDLKTYLPWDINTKVDRASMAYSLETRSPLLDYRVIEFAQSLPTNYKFDGDNQKRILKEVLYSHVPKHIFDRPKSGFGVPLSLWFKNELKDYVLSELSYDNLKDIPCIKPEGAQKLIDQHMSGQWDNYKIIWKLLVLKQWLSRNGDGFSIK